MEDQAFFIGFWNSYLKYYRAVCIFAQKCIIVKKKVQHEKETGFCYQQCP